MVRPVDRATLGIPLVDAAERHDIAYGETSDARGDVDVVRDEERLAGVQTQDEALVPGALVVVREDPDDGTLALDLEVGRVGVEGPRERSVAAGHSTGAAPRGAAARKGDQHDRGDRGEQPGAAHSPSR
jgi:hypothetical protein